MEQRFSAKWKPRLCQRTTIGSGCFLFFFVEGLAEFFVLGRFGAGENTAWAECAFLGGGVALQKRTCFFSHDQWGVEMNLAGGWMGAFPKLPERGYVRLQK